MTSLVIDAVMIMMLSTRDETVGFQTRMCRVKSFREAAGASLSLSNPGKHSNQLPTPWRRSSVGLVLDGVICKMNNIIICTEYPNARACITYAATDENVKLHF